MATALEARQAPPSIRSPSGQGCGDHGVARSGVSESALIHRGELVNVASSSSTIATVRIGRNRVHHGIAVFPRSRRLVTPVGRTCPRSPRTMPPTSGEKASAAARACEGELRRWRSPHQRRQDQAAGLTSTLYLRPAARRLSSIANRMSSAGGTPIALAICSAFSGLTPFRPRGCGFSGCLAAAWSSSSLLRPRRLACF